MIDHELSEQLHSLADSVNDPFDMPALRRRISVQSRRRTAVKVGVAGAGAAAVVGGLVAVRDRPADGELAAATSVTALAEPTPLPDCAVVLADVQAATTAAAPDVSKSASTAETAFAGHPEDTGFKGIVTILSVEGPRVTFSNDEPKVAPPTDGVGTLDASTEWVDGDTPLDTPPTLQVGEQVGLATSPVADGDDRVIFVDVNASPTDDKVVPDDKPAAPLGSTAPGVTIANDGGVLPAGPTRKSPGTITAVGPTTIDVTLETAIGEPGTPLVIDLAATTFYAGDTTCAPVALTVGTAVGVAYHLDEAGAPVSDAVLLLPPV
jgi:hypothetical protein